MAAKEAKARIKINKLLEEAGWRFFDSADCKANIALTQMPGYAAEAGWNNPAERDAFVQKNRLRFLRDYQKRAIQAIQDAVAEGHSRFLFEMATGTGKTLTAAAVIKLFLRTGNARRVLFLVDRLELEDQGNKAFIAQLKNDYTSVIYKERRDEWRKAEIVVTTVQSLLFNDKYRRLFSPTDFDLVISDEAHRSIGGNARAVFEYFVGYKLGLTATPRDYLKKFDAAKPGTRDPREAERRLLLDTYRTFGCESGQPTYRYSLLDGVREGYLINPVVVDARTDITTQLLSDEGYAAVAASAASVPDSDAAQESFFTNNKLLGSANFLDAYKTSKARVCVTVGMKYFFKAYATDGRLRDIIEKRRLTELNVNPAFNMADFRAVPREWRDRIPEYVKDYVSLNQFM